MSVEQVKVPFGPFDVTLNMLDLDGQGVQIVGIATAGESTAAEIDYVQGRLEDALLWAVFRDEDRAIKSIQRALATFPSKIPVQRAPLVGRGPIVSRIPKAELEAEVFKTLPDDEPEIDVLPTLRDPVAPPRKKAEGVYKCSVCGQLGHNKRAHTKGEIAAD
jgi:hypothetical protein